MMITFRYNIWLQKAKVYKENKLFVGFNEKL